MAGIGVVALALVAAYPPAEAEARPCGTVILKPGKGWIVGGAGLGCRKMRYWAKSMLLGEGTPPGWRCKKSGKGRSRSGGCHKGRRGYHPFFVYYPPD